MTMYDADLRSEPGAEASPDPLACVRARARIAVEAKALDGRSLRGAVHESGALRVRFPREHSSMLNATVVNVAGGMTGGDSFDLCFHAGAGARMVVSSTAAEKVYRSAGDVARVSVECSVAAGAFCAWLPQETIVYNHAKLHRSLDVEIGPDASFLACEMTVLGRTAMGEKVDTLNWQDRWRIRRGGKLIYADDTRLDGDATQVLSGLATGRGAHAFATLVYCGENIDDECTRMRDIIAENAGACEAGVSAFDGLLAARFAASDAQALRRLVTLCLEGFAGITLPRGWHT